MYYAPIAIPTLCRYKHFVRCIESLSNCTLADKTEVFVALDYPTNELQEDGYNRINYYLAHCNNLGFKKLHIIKRSKNLGVGKDGKGNLDQLIKEIFNICDRIIVSEDDNVFSPDFLEYMDKGLELFEQDNSVLAINGYSHPNNYKFDGNNYFHHYTDFSTWGFGIWRDRFELLNKEINQESILRKQLSIRIIFKIRQIGLDKLLGYLFLISHHRKYIWCTDTVLSYYMVIKGMTVIMPKLSKVRNGGWDDQSESLKNRRISKKIAQIAEKHNLQKIDSDKHFDYIGNPWNYFKTNNTLARKYSDNKMTYPKFVIKAILQILKFLKREYIKKLFKNGLK